MKRKPTTKSLKCERCGHSWDEHEHSENPVPRASREWCTQRGCPCECYVGLGPVSLRSTTKEKTT